MKALISFLPLLAEEKGRLIRALTLSALTLAVGIGLLGLSGWFLTAAALSTAGAAFNLFGPSAGVRGLTFTRILSRYGEKLSGHDVTLRLLSRIRQWLFGTLFPILPLRDLNLGRGDLVSRLVGDVDALDNAFLVSLGPLTTALLGGFALSLGLAAVLPAAAIGFAVCFFGATLLVPVLLVVGSRRAGAGAVTAAASLRGRVLDAIDGHRDLVVFAAEGRTRAEVAAAAAEVGGARRTLGWLGAAASGAVQLLGGLAALSVLWAGLLALEAGRIDGPVLAALVFAAMASFEAAAPLIRSATRLSAAAAAAERLRALADQPPAIREPQMPKAIETGATLEFRDVNFAYARRPVLQDVCFSVAAGERVAITGPSGAGKSTIALLALRLADPASGTVSIGGVDLREIASCNLHRYVALMTQDAPVFLDSIRANLLIGNPAADDKALWAALAAAHLDVFVEGLPQGLDTLVGEAGATLSTGQARRLALARTLLSPARILVLDEPTSGLDRETEEAFFTDLAQVADGRTVILITHAGLPRGTVDRTLTLRAGRLTD